MRELIQGKQLVLLGSQQGRLQEHPVRFFDHTLLIPSSVVLVVFSASLVSSLGALARLSCALHNPVPTQGMPELEGMHARTTS